MFDRLLIPLDGSRLAESVLPLAGALARRFASAITLLHVVEPRPPAEVHGEPHLGSVPEADRYLSLLAEGVLAGLTIDRHVHAPGAADVAGIIARHAEEFEASLIVLCDHGRSGARDLLYGRVAQRVLRQGTVPVLLIKPEAVGRTLAGSQILVPLDGSAASESALRPAGALARAFDGRLVLQTVVPTISTVPTDRSPAALLLPGATAASLEMEEEDVRRYLADLASRTRVTGLDVDARIDRGDPAIEIVAAADRLHAGLVVLSTHGRSGMNAVWAGSVASRVVARCRRPMLLVRALAP
jgi:nucleotide-binding universal stress UspA family protein